MMLIVIADALMATHSFDEADDHTGLLDQQSKLPSIITNFLTKDLDFHQKEHLRACRHQPNDWAKKVIRIKEDLTTSSYKKVTSPDVISFNLTWQQSSPKDVLTTLNMIPSQFKLSDMFEISADVEDKQYYFKGMICYWGLHYFCFIRHITAEGEFWVEYNDKELFKMPNWAAIVYD